MARRGRLRRAASAAVLAGSLCAVTAPARAQSLADVAEREAARRAAISTPAPLYTNMARSSPAPIDAATVEAAKEAVTAWRADDAIARTRPTPNSEPSAPERTPSRPPAPGTPAMPAFTEWSSFAIPKTAAELEAGRRLQAQSGSGTRTRVSDIVLPRQHDTMRMSTAIGYLQGADAGGDVSGSGMVNGMQTDFSSFFTVGRSGFESRSARLSVFAPDGRWRGEAGDMFSDVRGLARGARVSWSLAERWRPSVAVYVRRAGAPGAQAAVSYRDHLQLTKQMRVGGELASDGAVFVQGQFARPGQDVTAFLRDIPGVAGGRDTGLSGGVTLPHRIGLSAAIRVSDAAGDAGQWQLASIRLPLMARSSMTLERSWWTGAAGVGSTNAVIVQLPMGPLSFIQRVQWGHTDYPQRAVPFGFDRRQMQSTASYRMPPWGTVGYQQSTQWFEDGRTQQFDELSFGVKMGRRTSAHLVTAFPDLYEPERFRLRMAHKVTDTLSLEGQYGRLSAFQGGTTSQSESSRVMMTVRKDWQLSSPSRGGEVHGRALDQAGAAVSGALVRLGPYSTITDDTGAYGFTRVPNGPFELLLDRDKLPAAYGLDEAPRPLVLTRGSRTVVDLHAIPLNAIRGRVYQDRNGNARFDEGEGVVGAVIAIGATVTATTEHGAYAFYNQPPGRHAIRLDAARLAKGLSPLSPATRNADLLADRPLLDVDFVVEFKDRPILMRELPR